MKKGFTLIELLIVIGILAILVTAVVLVINPQEILARSRDSQRVSDFRSLRNAIDLYLVRGTGTLSLGSVCTSGSVSYAHQWRGTVTAMSATQQPFVSSGALNGTQVSATIANVRAITGAGWVPVVFTNITGGSPISKLPVDPKNVVSTNAESTLITPNSLLTEALGYKGSYFYAYQCFGLTYEIAANMESAKYRTDSVGDADSVENKDGGVRARHNTALAGSSCVDGVPPAVATCYGAPLTGLPSFLADQIYQVGNDPGLDL